MIWPLLFAQAVTAVQSEQAAARAVASFAELCADPTNEFASAARTAKAKGWRRDPLDSAGGLIPELDARFQLWRSPADQPEQFLMLGMKDGSVTADHAACALAVKSVSSELLRDAEAHWLGRSPDFWSDSERGGFWKLAPAHPQAIKVQRSFGLLGAPALVAVEVKQKGTE